MGQTTFLAVDVGNTRTSVAVFVGERIVRRLSVPTAGILCIKDAENFLWDAIPHRLVQMIDRAAIASVVPKATGVLKAAIRRHLGLNARIITPANCGMRIAGYRKRQLGVDRVVNAFAAYVKFGRPAIVVDAGSCITFDAVDARGRFLGGAIFPGIPLLASSLAKMTARIPRISFKRVRMAIGKDTASSVRSAMSFGLRALVDSVVDAMAKEMKTRPILIATGGDARMIVKLSKKKFRIEKDLTLFGIYSAQKEKGDR
jgi:type III pantothenate kinase